MIKFTLFFICALISLSSYSQKDTASYDTTKVIKLQECVISVYRANKNTPVTFKDIDVKELNLKSVGQEPSFILNQTPSINSYLLIIDTDINITKSYSRFLFNRKLKYESWVDDVNKCDLYIFLDNDVPYVQDGTRLIEADRNSLKEYHIRELNAAGIKYHIIKGDWNERFKKSLELILNNA